MHRSRLDTQEVYKWKAHLNVHGGKQKYGVDYWDTYSPVVQWTTTRLFLILSVLRGWNCRQLDFVVAYPQAPSDVETNMEFPKGISSLGDPATHVLLLLQNIYACLYTAIFMISTILKGNLCFWGWTGLLTNLQGAMSSGQKLG